MIEITAAEVVPADRIDADFARAEGEGYDTVDGWRRAHETFFGRTLGDTPINAIRFRLTDLVVAERYRGPAGSGNGGYTSGLVASLLGGSDVEVTLRVPPPLETPLRIDGSSIYAPASAVGQAAGARAEDPAFGGGGDTLVAEATRATVDLDLPTPPPSVEAGRRTRTIRFPAASRAGPAATTGSARAARVR